MASADTGVRMDPKELAGRRAAQFVKDGMIVGLGTGTTASWAVRGLADRIKNDEVKDVHCICTSTATRELADEVGLSVRGLEDVEGVDLTIDGADQVDDELRLIKGAGGALLREKVVAFSSDEMIIVVDETKMTKQLGLGVAVPVEVIPFAEAVVRQALSNLGAEVDIKMEPDGDDPLITDNDNLILDCMFPEAFDAKRMEREIKRIPGVVENGLFVDVADRLVVGRADGSVEVIDAI